MMNGFTLDYVSVGVMTDVLPATPRGPMTPNAMMMHSRQRASTDSIGNYILALENVVVGSRVLVIDQDGTTQFYNAVTSASSLTITIPVYVGGSPLNNLRLSIRKASSAPFYQPFETVLTSFKGAPPALFIQQLPDQ